MVNVWPTGITSVGPAAVPTNWHDSVPQEMLCAPDNVVVTLYTLKWLVMAKSDAKVTVGPLTKSMFGKVNELPPFTEFIVQLP